MRRGLENCSCKNFAAAYLRFLQSEAWGGLVSTPVINHPEVGILAVGKIIKRPVYDDAGNLRPADLMYLSFSFDHRVLDGHVGAAFGNAVIEHLQQPAVLLV